MDGQGVRRVIRFSRRVRAGWKDDRAGGLAGEMAFFALLSVFPGLLAVAAAIGWLDGLFGEDLLRRVERQLLDVLETFLSDNAEGTVGAVEALFRKGSGGVFTVGMVTALWSASRGTATALRAIAAIYDTEDERSAIRRRLLALGLAVGSMLVISLMLAMLVLGPLLGVGRAAAAALGVDALYGTVWEWLGLPVAFVILVAWATAILHVAPHVHRGWRSHLVAGALVGVGWLLGSLALRFYLAVLGGNPVFGILGGALVVIVWMYLLSLALMLGAEVNAVLDEPEEPPLVAEPRHWDERGAGYGPITGRQATARRWQRMENVVVLKLADLDGAREAMRELQRLHRENAVRLAAVAVVKGNGEGRMTVVEDQEANGSTGTAAGATMGGVLGLLSAPAEVVVEGAAGTIVSSIADIADVDGSEAPNTSGSAAPSTTAVTAVVSEPTPTALDRLATRCGAGLVRRARPDVDRELAAIGAAVLATRAEGAPERGLGERVNELKDVLTELLGRTR